MFDKNIKTTPIIYIIKNTCTNDILYGVAKSSITSPCKRIDSSSTTPWLSVLEFVKVKPINGKIKTPQSSPITRND